MVKIKWLAVTAIIVLVGVLATVAFAADPIKLYVDGREIKPDVPPQLINGRTMVPLRWVAEALGAGVQWDEDARTVKITTEEKAVGTDFNLTPDQQRVEAWLRGQLNDLLTQQYQHYRILDKHNTLQAIEFPDSGVEAEYLTRVTTVIDIATPAEWPVHKGKIKYLEENRDALSPEALAAVEEDIAFWNQELEELYIGVPSDSNQFLKVKAELDGRDAIKPDTVRFYGEDPMGKYVPLDFDEPGFKSEEELIEMGYEEMRQLVDSKS